MVPKRTGKRNSYCENPLLSFIVETESPKSFRVETLLLIFELVINGRQHGFFGMRCEHFHF